MRKLLMIVLMVALLCPFSAQGEEDAFRVVTSFYPMYVLTANVVEGVEGVALSNMTAPETGCLHDYQLLPGDMRALADADIFIINGAGMEQFLDKVIAQYATMPIIDTSAGIDLIYDGGHVHGAGEDDHGHDEEMPNPHLWLDPRNAAIQVRNIGEGLAQADAAHAQQYRANAEAYAAKLEALYEEMHQGLAELQDRRIVTFHDAFPYFACAFDLEIIETMNLEGDTQPSTRALADMVDLVRDGDIHALFAEPQYDAKTVNIVAAETDAQVYVLDPVATGELVPDAYETAMRRNAGTLKEALGQ